MTYKNVAQITQSSSLFQRLTACAATQVDEYAKPKPYPQWIAEHIWEIAASPGWADKWAYAMATHPEEDYDPGDDESVITDGDILAVIQPMDLPEPVEESTPSDEGEPT